jgi:membrane-bound ClpP family serine protease
MNYGFWAIVNLSLVIILIAAEIFIPSGGLISLVMVFAYVSAIYCAYMAWWETLPVLFWSFCGFSLLCIPVTFVAAFWWLERSSWGKRILLEAPTSDEVTPFAAEELRLKKFIGSKATTLTPLNPGGMISMEGERIHCISQGLMIEANQLVKVLGVSGTRLIVEKTTASEDPIPATVATDTFAEPIRQDTDVFLEDAQKAIAPQPIDFNFSDPQ